MRVNSFLWPEAILQLLYVITDSSSSSTVSSAKTIGNGHLRPNSGSHHNRDQQPDLVKVSSPKLSELVRLESVVDAKTQENAQLRARLGHNAKGFEALAITVNQYAKKVRKILKCLRKVMKIITQLFFVIFVEKVLIFLLASLSSWKLDHALLMWFLMTLKLQIVHRKSIIT